MKTNFRISKIQSRRAVEINTNGIMGWLSVNDRAEEIESGNQVFENGEIQVVFSRFEPVHEITVNQVFSAIANELVNARAVEHPEGAEYNYYENLQGAANAATKAVK